MRPAVRLRRIREPGPQKQSGTSGLEYFIPENRMFFAFFWQSRILSCSAISVLSICVHAGLAHGNLLAARIRIRESPAFSGVRENLIRW